MKIDKMQQPFIKAKCLLRYLANNYQNFSHIRKQPSEFLPTYQKSSNSTFSNFSTSAFDGLGKSVPAASVPTDTDVVPSSSFQETSVLEERLAKIRLFRRRCKELTFIDSGLTPGLLAYFPLEAARLGQERYFVQNFLHPWWSAVQPQLRRVLPSDLVKGCFFGLKKINSATGGEVVRNFSLKAIATLTDAALDVYVDISPKNFDLLLHALNDLVRNADKSDPCFDEILGKIQNTFPLIIAAACEGRLRKFAKIGDTIGYIALRAYELGLTKPTDNCLKQLVVLFYDCLRSYERKAPSFENLKSGQRMAHVLLNWNVNADLYVDEFWALWFDCVFRFLRRSGVQSGLITCINLQYCLRVALAFGKENEFESSMDVWMKMADKNRRFFTESYRNLLLNDLKSKRVERPDAFSLIAYVELLAFLEGLTFV